MRWHVYPDHEAASVAVAAKLAEFVLGRPQATFALPSGNTPKRVYELLVPHAPAFKRVCVFALDEYLGLPADDPRSFAAFFREYVFGPLGIEGGRARVLNGAATDAIREAAQYESMITAYGGLDLTFLGLGGNGHIAFNEPADVLEAHTHVAALKPPATEVAPQGITMGIGTLFSAPKVLMLATGAKKSQAVRAMLRGPIDPRCPASLLQAHPDAEVFLDTAAAADL
ncbi:MAG: glucosamine-6-phosphate isomerase [Cyanobacteria bacterium RYN_339]|nr:glucosamine-6-phosphate isomerase [Cyanobacteria bacterium RYN_339]